MNEREIAILDILNKKKRAGVAELSDILGVSQVTIRKDLSDLEDSGIIKREHGFAVAANTNDVAGRIVYKYEAKKKIAAKAAELVHDGDTVMIETGSCCALFADELVRTKKDLTVITNSLFIPGFIRNKSNFRIIVLGGECQQDAQVNVGPLIGECAAGFLVDMFFIGVDGYSSGSGFSNKDPLRADAVNHMAAQADKVIVLTTGDKFDHHSTVPYKINNIKEVITDVLPDSHIISALSRRGINVVCTDR